MKKYLLSLTLLLIYTFSLIPPILANNGENCNTHGGVNCNIGPDTDGSVICNDNFKDSSQQYKMAEECWQFTQNSSPLECHPPNPNGCTNEIDLIRKQAKLYEQGSLEVHEILHEIQICQQQIDIFKRDIENFQICLLEYEKRYENNKDYSLYTYTLNHLHNFCHQNYGYESMYNEVLQNCECLDNYWLNPQTKKCELKYFICSEYFGKNAEPDDKKCICKDDHKFNWDTYSCEYYKPSKKQFIEDILLDKYQRPAMFKTIEQLTENLPYRINNNGKIIYTAKPTEIPLGYMLKAHSDPKVYIMTEKGDLKWIASEEVAIRLYGNQWDKYIIWLEESLVYTYNILSPVYN